MITDFNAIVIKPNSPKFSHQPNGPTKLLADSHSYLYHQQITHSLSLTISTSIIYM